MTAQIRPTPTQIERAFELLDEARRLGLTDGWKDAAGKLLAEVAPDPVAVLDKFMAYLNGGNAFSTTAFGDAMDAWQSVRARLTAPPPADTPSLSAARQAIAYERRHRHYKTEDEINAAIWRGDHLHTPERSGTAREAPSDDQGPQDAARSTHRVPS